MAQTLEKFVVIRVLESTRQRLKVKAVKGRKKLYEVADEMSKNECV